MVSTVHNVFATVNCKCYCGLIVQANYKITVRYSPRRSIFARSILCIVGDLSSISRGSLWGKMWINVPHFLEVCLSLLCFVVTSFTRNRCNEPPLANSLCPSQIQPTCEWQSGKEELRAISAFWSLWHNGHGMKSLFNVSLLLSNLSFNCLMQMIISNMLFNYPCFPYKITCLVPFLVIS